MGLARELGAIHFTRRFQALMIRSLHANRPGKRSLREKRLRGGPCCKALLGPVHMLDGFHGLEEPRASAVQWRRLVVIGNVNHWCLQL